MTRFSSRWAPHLVVCLLIMISLIIAAIAPSLGATASAAQSPAPRLRAVAVTIGETDLAWSAATNVGVAQYRIYRNDQVLATVTSNTLVYVDSTVQISTIYSYRVEALDAAGRSLTTSNRAKVKLPGRPETPDTTAPSPPEELSVVARNGYNALDWDDASDDTDLTAYRIYRNGKLLATVDSGTRSYTDSNVQPGVGYSYALEGIDTVGHRSSPVRAVAKARGQLATGQLSAPSAGGASAQSASGSAVYAALSTAAYSANLRRYPYLTDLVNEPADLTKGYATINWATDQLGGATGSAKWGQVALDGTCTPDTSVAATKKNLVVNSVSEYQWKAQLTLTPDTKYCYRVYLGSTDLLGADPSPQFLTQVPAGSNEPFTFAVLGDWGSTDSAGANPDQANLMQQIAASGARFALTTGDTGYSSGSQLNYGDLVETGPSTSGIFGPLFWKVAGATIPLFPATGNHGYGSTNTEHPHLLNWPQDRAAATSNGRYIRETYCCLNGTLSKSYPSAWYAFDAGNARFYVLTASWDEGNLGTAEQYQNDYDNHWTPSGAQLQWLENDLATHPTALKFAFFHYPLYSANTSQESDTYLQGANSLEGLLGSHGVNIVFNGHAHIYQRNHPLLSGMVSAVTGGGGAKAASVRACSTTYAYAIGWSYTSNEGTACGSASPPPDPSHVYHYLRVTVNGTHVTVEPTDELGRTFDVMTFDFGGGTSTATPTNTATPTDTPTNTATPTDTPTRTPTNTPTPGSGATSLTFPVEADAYVASASLTTNFGADTRLYADTSPNQQSYLRFTITGVTGSVQSVKLRLYAGDGTTDGPQVYATSNQWTETGITWSNKPATIGASSDDKGAISSSTWVEFNVTPLVTGNGAYSFALVPMSSDGLSLYSREATTTANRPQLVVTQITP